MPAASNKRHTAEGSLCEWMEHVRFDRTRQISPPLYPQVIQKLFRWTNSNIIVHVGKTAGTICAGAATANPTLALRTFSHAALHASSRDDGCAQGRRGSGGASRRTQDSVRKDGYGTE